MMVIKKLTCIVVIIILKLFTWETCAQSLLTDSFDHPIPLDNTVRHGTLENNFTYYLKKTRGPSKEVYMKLAVKAGSFFETRSQEGYAHLLEHVALYNKNPTNSKSMLKNAGMFIRGQTGQIVTKYQLIIPNANKEKFVLGMDALKSWGGKIQFDESQINVQRGAVLGEMRTKDPYRDWLNNGFGKILMQNVDFPMFSKERAVKNIKDFKMSSLKEFYNDWYRPDMQAVIIVGDINLDSIQSLIEKKFSNLINCNDRKNYQNILEKFTIQLKGSNQYEFIKDSVDTKSRIILFNKEKNYAYNTISERDYYHMFLQKMVNDIAQKRSHKILKQYNPPFSNYTTKHTVSTFFANQVLVSALEVNLNVNPMDMDRKISSTLTAYKSLFSQITDQEVQEARRTLESEFTQNYENNLDLAEAYLENFVRGSAVPSPSTQAKLHNILSNIKVSEVQSFADKKSNLLTNQDFVFINISKENLPAKKKMVNTIEHISRKSIPFNPPSVKMDLHDSIVNLKNLHSTISEQSINLVGVTRVKLTNGINLWLKPSKPISSEFKNQIELLGFRPMATGRTNKNITPEIMAHCYASYAGAGGFNKFQVAQYLEEYNIN
ncbi:MAG: insulinase family protein, partial [Gelidibacter sp.]